MNLSERIVLVACLVFTGLGTIVGCAAQTAVSQRDGSAPLHGLERGGSPFQLKEHRVGDTDIGTMYLNRTGLGQGGSLFPEIVRISVARAGDILYQLDFFTVDDAGRLLPDFEVVPLGRFAVGTGSRVKGVILTTDPDESYRAHLAILQGELTIGGDFLASFTGHVMFAVSTEVTQYAQWQREVDNTLVRQGSRVALAMPHAFSITSNLLK